MASEPYKPNVTKIDGVNFVQREVPLVGGGSITLMGLTKRALLAALAEVDADDLIVYSAEQTEESRQCDLVLGVVAGVAYNCPAHVCFIVGPEAMRGLRSLGLVE